MCLVIAEITVMVLVLGALASFAWDDHKIAKQRKLKEAENQKGDGSKPL